MRYFMTALAALSLGALPLTAQVPVRPAPPTPPAQPATPPAPLTEQQRQQHQAIREKYAKEFQAHRDAMQALNEKMRAEIDATLTPEQRQARQQGAGRRMGMGGGRGLGMGQGGGRGPGMGQGGGRMGAMPPEGGQPQQRMMLWNRADRAARQIIMMRNRMAMHAMMRGQGMGQMGQPGMMGGRRGGMMGGKMGQGDMMGDMAPKATSPKVVKSAPAKAPPPPPVPAKKSPTSGGGF